MKTSFPRTLRIKSVQLCHDHLCCCRSTERGMLTYRLVWWKCLKLLLNLTESTKSLTGCQSSLSQSEFNVVNMDNVKHEKVNEKSQQRAPEDHQMLMEDKSPVPWITPSSSRKTKSVLVLCNKKHIQFKHYRFPRYQESITVQWKRQNYIWAGERFVLYHNTSLSHASPASLIYVKLVDWKNVIYSKPTRISVHLRKKCISETYWAHLWEIPTGSSYVISNTILNLVNMYHWQDTGGRCMYNSMGREYYWLHIPEHCVLFWRCPASALAARQPMNIFTPNKNSWQLHH